MCGIAGIIGKGPNEMGRLKNMTDAIAHRGPDGEGQWQNDKKNVSLGHRRLAIIDLSDCAAQPMHYLDRYTIVFNGEIYNYIEIKEQLLKKGYIFKSHSDTEVLLALYHDAGMDCLQQLDGMFSFVLFDKKENILFCARDRFGEKPFYYSVSNNEFLFASEMKALWAAGVSRSVNNTLLYNYFVWNLIDNPEDNSETFYEHIHKLPPSSYLKLDISSLNFEIKKYWDIDLSAIDKSITDEQAAKRLHELFRMSVNRRLRSDVPVGSSLSGGLDSSLVVCTIDEIDKEKKINRKTFSAQFPGYEKDESYYQNLVIKQCHVDPHFIHPTASSMLNNLNKILYHQEEPFISASICAQYEVFGLAKQNNVTVLLDGQGADEILAGYHYYFPFFFNGINGKALQTERKSFKNLEKEGYANIPILPHWKKNIKKAVPEKMQQLLLGKKRKLDNGENNLHADFVKAYGQRYKYLKENADLKQALYFNTLKSGLEILLRYADRNSMAHSREVRLPFLNHELVSFLFTLPDHLKIRNGWTKWIMRKTFDDVLPQEITWRKDKIGYEPPQNKWMQNKVFQEEIHDSVNDLIKQKILKPGAADGLNQNNFNWKSFVVARTLYTGN